MWYSLLWTVVTAVVLMVCAAADRPRRSRVVTDAYRPSLERYQCKYGALTPALLWILVIGHMAISLVCVVSVRNGMEAFNDGMVIKESFLLLYAFLLVVYVLQQLQLSLSTLYVLRTACLGAGITLFCFRLLIGRCFKCWVPASMRLKLQYVYKKYISSFFVTVSYNSLVASSTVDRLSDEGSVRQGDGDSPLYANESPTSGSMDEMLEAMLDPERQDLFLSLSEKVKLYDYASLIITYIY